MDRDTPKQGDKAAYRILEELDRLEDLLEEMESLVVATRDEVIARMEALSAELDRDAES